jgi:pimeloyl-ACP methyl ester carboxylesterase
VRKTQPSPAEDPIEGYVESAEGRLHYLNWGGSGPQAHLLHANGFCAGTYSPFIAYLRADLQVFASDVRGHGDSVLASARPIRHWRIFAEDLRLIVEAAMTAPVIGIGHSLGAVATYMAASLYPHLFSGIVLLDPVILPRSRLWSLAVLKRLGLGHWIPLARGARRRHREFADKHKALERFAAGRGIFKSWSRDFIEAYLECGLLEREADSAILKCDPEIEAQIFESVPLDIWAYARGIACPVLAIRGESSPAFLPAAAARLARRIDDYTWITLRQAGHFVPMEQPQACAQAIMAFLRDHDLVDHQGG